MCGPGHRHDRQNQNGKGKAGLTVGTPVGIIQELLHLLDLDPTGLCTSAKTQSGPRAPLKETSGLDELQRFRQPQSKGAPKVCRSDAQMCHCAILCHWYWDLPLFLFLLKLLLLFLRLLRNKNASPIVLQLLHGAPGSLAALPSTWPPVPPRVHEDVWPCHATSVTSPGGRAHSASLGHLLALFQNSPILQGGTATGPKQMRTRLSRKTFRGQLENAWAAWGPSQNTRTSTLYCRVILTATTEKSDVIS